MMNSLHPSPFQSNRCSKPSISQFSQQTIVKSAVLYEHDVVNGDGDLDTMIIDVIDDLDSDAEIDIEYDDEEDEYVTKKGSETTSNHSNVYRKGTNTKWTKEQMDAELAKEMNRQQQMMKVTVQ